MHLSDTIAAYLADRQAKGIAPATRRNDKRTLSLLLSDVGNIQVKHLRPQHMDVFWARREAWAPGTMNRARGDLATFFRWCQTRGHMSRTTDLLEGTRPLRVAPRSRVIIPQGEFETFLAEISDPRNRIVAALGLYLFVRISEIAALRWQDLDLDGDTVDVFRPKTVTLDTLPICAELKAHLVRWRMEYAAKMGSQVAPAWFVIPRQNQAKWRGVEGKVGFTMQQPASYDPHQKSYINGTITRLLDEAGYYQSGEGGHTLRRSGAIALYNQLSSVGHDRAIRVCQAMLGHASIANTEIYLRLDLDRKVRNDLLAGKLMFPEQAGGQVISLGKRANGRADGEDLCV